MEKRNFFEELMQGFDELKREREGKLMLRNQDAETLPLTAMSTEGTGKHQIRTVPTGAIDH